MNKYVDIDQQAVARGEADAINIRFRSLATGTFPCVRASSVEILGPSTVRYCPNNPRPFGARAWVETESAVVYKNAEFPNGQRME